MNEQQLQQVMDKRDQRSQFTINKTKFHTHNGVDSPRVNAGFMLGGKYILSGKVNLSAGVATITNRLITPESVIVVTSESTIIGTGNFNIAAGCFQGYAFISEGSASRGDRVNYIITI